MHSLDVYMNIAESNQTEEPEETETINLKQELRESLYLQDILVTVSKLNEKQQQYILDLINTAVTNLGRLTVEDDSNE